MKRSLKLSLDLVKHTHFGKDSFLSSSRKVSRELSAEMKVISTCWIHVASRTLGVTVAEHAPFRREVWVVSVATAAADPGAKIA